MARTSKKSSEQRPIQIDAEHMRIFVAIGQARTLTEAAAFLQMPLFTVSRALKRIETTTELMLVRRDAFGLQLTGVGWEYFKACREVLDAYQGVAEVLTSHRKEPEGTLRIGAPLPFVRHVLSVVLPDFRKLYPRLKIDITPYCSDWDQPPKAAHDVFLKVRTPKDSRHHLKIFPAIRQGLFASPQYLAEHSVPAHPFQLEQHFCLGQTRDHSAFAWKLIRQAEQLVLTPNFAVVVPDVNALAQLALRSAGIAVLPLWLAYAEVSAGHLVRVLEDWAPEEVVFCALLHSSRSRMASKEKTFLNFLDTILGMELDPRCQGKDPALFFLSRA